MLKFIKKNYLLLIFVILLISYGQILKMLPWQDDNALFFKLAHIKEAAGFLGKGMLGEGAYKYTAFFYYPIYLIFGYKEFYYFAFAFVLYGLSAFVVYKVASRLLDENSGMLAGFLYACGFIGSDSFIRLFNSIVTSISVILVCFFVLAYWYFYKKNKIRWYFLALFVFSLASEFARARTHYLVALPIIFEILFLSYKKPFLKSMTSSMLRIAPFLPIFYRYVILEDYRSKEAGNFIISVLQGGYYKIFGFLSSLTNLILPDWLIKILSPEKGTMLSSGYLSNSTFYFLIIGGLALLSCIYAFAKKKKFRTYSVSFLTFSLIWNFVSSKIFINPGLVVTPDQILIAFIGGELLFLALMGIFLIDKKYKLLYLFLISGILINMMSYSAYNPIQVYEKINRYLSHSFVYLVIFLSFLYYAAGEKTKKIVLVILLTWGFNNLIEGYLYQKSILINRTAPVRAFYKEFEKYVPKVGKNDIVYFDVEDSVRGSFANAFSVAQMPDTTAIAWRYGIDRDDFWMFENSKDFFEYLKYNKFDKKTIRTFFYSKDGLFETTTKFTALLNSGKILPQNFVPKTSVYSSNKTANGSWIGKSEIELKDLNIQSLVPFKISVDILGNTLDIASLGYAVHYGFENLPSSFTTDNKLVSLAFDYKKFRNEFSKSKLSVTSTWQDRVGKNLIDQDQNSSWQADRLLWLKSDQSITVNMVSANAFNRLAFVNSFSDSSPLEFDMFYSNDGVSWSTLHTYKNSQRLQNGGFVTVRFDDHAFKYFKIHFKKTLNGDSPAISEMWLIPSKFEILDIHETEQFLSNVFSNVPNYPSYLNLLKETGYKGNVDLYWSNNKNFGWQKDVSSRAIVTFDGKNHSYSIPVVPGGTTINSLKFVVNNYPGALTVTGIKVLY